MACRAIFSNRVLLSDGSIKPAVIQIEGALIRDVTAVENRDSVDISACVNLGHRLVTPALVNAHTHLPMAALRGIEGCAAAMSGDVVRDLYFNLETKMTPDDVRAFARMGCYESLLSGVGLVWEHYYHGRALAEAFAETGLAGVIAPTLQDLSGPGVPWLDEAFAETAAIARDPNMKAKGIFAALGPHATDTVSDDLWRRVVSCAKELGGLPIHFHVGQSIQEFEAAHARGSPGQRTPLGLLENLGVLGSGLPLMLIHGQYATAADVKRLNPSNHVLCFCPRSHMQFCFPTPVSRWRALGINLALATDAAANNDDMNVQHELRMLAGQASFESSTSSELHDFWNSSDSGDAEITAARALHARRQAIHDSGVAKSLRDPWTLLRSVWTIPGSLHPSFTAGVIAPQALANLAVWDPSHPNLWPASDLLASLVKCDIGPALDGLMVSGRWIGRTPHDETSTIKTVPQTSWQASIWGSDAYKHAREDASKRLDDLLLRAGLKHGRGLKRPADSS